MIWGRRRRDAVEDTTIALAGAGAIAVVHALAAPAAGARVVAVASAGGTSARHLAGQLDDQHRHDVHHVRVDELPAGVDLLVVATPPPTHAELALQGLAAGADVLVEKPFATTLDEADRLVDAASAVDAGGPILRCAENLLHAPAWAAVTAHRATMGPLRHLSARTLQSPPTWGHFTEPLTAGGVLFDLGPHPLALVMVLAGEPVVAVSAEMGSGRPDGADDDAQVLLRFRSGLEATVDVSWTAGSDGSTTSSPQAEWALQAASDDGVVRLELYPEVLVELDGEPVAVDDRHPGAADPLLERMGYIDQLTHLESSQTPEAARDVLEVICAAYQSAGRSGDEVALPFTGDRSLTPMQLWKG